jgi:putative endonuclease
MPSFVYMLANKPNGVLYVGVTSNLVKRVSEHKEKFHAGFTKRYGVDQLVWYEVFDDIEAAIQREKQIKKWNRAWKVRRILDSNPEWKDLFADIWQ